MGLLATWGRWQNIALGLHLAHCCSLARERSSRTKGLSKGWCIERRSSSGNKPWQGEQDAGAKQRWLASPWWGLFTTLYTLSRLLHGYLPNRKNNFTRCVFLQLPLVVLISRDIVRPRRWRRLATESAGVEVTGLLAEWYERRESLHFPWQWR